jgi:hypothetical protein
MRTEALLLPVIDANAHLGLQTLFSPCLDQVAFAAKVNDEGCFRAQS